MNIDLYSIAESSSFYYVKNELHKIEIKWSKNICNDLKDLSKSYFDSAYEICLEIVENDINDNEKYDMWFLPCVYLFRQSIELIIKAGLAQIIKSKPKLQEGLLRGKHNLVVLFEIYRENIDIINLDEAEQSWIEKYLKSIEVVDENSDLFRYPFNDDFLSQYRNEFLDIADIGNRFILCHSILNKCFFKEIYEDNEEIFKEAPKFLSLASNGINNCYLWESPWGDSFHKQIIGHSNTGEYLFDKYMKTKESKYVYPVIFLLRNAIELALKRLIYVQTRVKVPDSKVRKIRNTHLLYKDLWKNIKPVLIYYAEISGEDLQQLEIAEKYIKEISSIDKNGDMFRYPFSYSFEYRFNNKIIDFENVYIYLQSIFSFLDGCDGMLDNIKEYENDYDY